MVALTGVAQATPYYWDNTTTSTWTTGANWSSNSNGVGGTPNTPLSIDTVVFNGSTINGNETIQLSGATSIAGMTFNNTGTTTIKSSSATTQTLTLGTGGITENTGAGAVTIGDATDGVGVSVNGSQDWNSSTGTLSILNGVTNSSSASGTATITFNGSGSTVVGISSGTTGITDNGSGKIALSISNGKVFLQSGSSFTGGTSLSGGTLYLNTANALGSSSSDSLTITGGTLDDDNASATVNTPVAFIINGSFSALVSNNHSLTQSGSVTFDSGANAITNNGFNVSALNLNLAQTSGVTFNSGATLTLSGSSYVNFGTGVSGNTWSAASTNTITLTTGSSGGHLSIDAANGATIANNFSDNASSLVAFEASESTGVTNTYSGVISGAGTFDQNGTGTGTSILSGPNTYTGTTSINGGILNLGVAQSGTTSGPLGAGASTQAIVFGGGTLQYSSSNNTDYSVRIAAGTSASAVSIDTNGQSVTFATGLTSSQSGGLTKLGSGTLTLTATNAYVGATTITAGVLQIGAGSTTGSLPTGSTISDAGSLIFDRSDAIVQGTAFSGSAISGGGALTQAGSGTVTLNAANTYTGVTTVENGTLATSVNAPSGGAGAFGNASSSIALGDATSISSNLSPTLLITTAGVSVARAITVGSASTSTSGTYTIGGSNGSGTATYTGGITLNQAATLVAASGGVTDFTSGTWATGNNAFTIGSSGSTGTVQLDNAVSTTGGIGVAYGTLALNSTFSSGSATVASGATLTGSGTVNGSTTVTGTINPGTVGGIGTLHVASTSGSLTFQNGSTFAVDLNSSTSDELVSGGAVNFNGTDNITFNGSTGATTTTGVANYVLATATSGLTSSAFTGTTPTDYHLVGTGTQLNLTHEATIGAITPTLGASTPTGSIITGGSLPFTIQVANSAPSGSSSLSASTTTGANVTGSTSTITTAAQGTSLSYSGLSFDGTTVGAGQTGSFTVSDSSADNSPQTGSVTVNVYGHAAPSLSATTLNLGYVHQGYSSAVTSNSVTATNGTGGAYIVNLKGSGTSSGGVSLNTISGVTAGSSANIQATLATGQSPETFSSQTYTMADDSTLSGASSSLSTSSITVTGEVYSGKSTWTGTGTNGAWGSVATAFGANWGTNQGSPGLDPSFTGTDTATFAAVTGNPANYTVKLNDAAPNLNSIAFNAASTSYTITQGTGSNSITLSGTTPSISVLAGTQSISAPVILGAATSAAVSSGQQLTISGGISGSNSLSNTGAGVTILSNDSGYSGGTTISNGTLYANNAGGASYTAPSSPTRTVTPSNSTGSATGTGAVTVTSGGTLAGSGTIATSGGVSVTSGGSISSGAAQTGAPNITGTGLTFNNTSVSLASANLTFDLGAGNPTGAGFHTFSNPNTSSTYMNLTGSSTLNFSGTDSISLVDLTGGALSLRQGTPYLLAQAGSDADYTGLVTSLDGGLDDLTLNGNGYVIGVGTLSLYTPITIDQFGPTSSTALTPGPSGIYPVPVLYLENGDLEVVPEPGTWALMLGGLTLLILIQRRKNKMD